MIPGNTSSGGKYVGPPTNISASAGNAQVTVSFTPPVYDGKGVATYVVTASPGGATASGSASPITVAGLSNGTSYTFIVTTISGYGINSSSGASSAVIPQAPAPPPPPPPPPPPQPPQVPCDNKPCGCNYSPGPEKCAPCMGTTPCGGPANGCTCDGQASYFYYCQYCPTGEGGYHGAFREGCCGYSSGVTPPVPPPQPPPPPPPGPPSCATCLAAVPCAMPHFVYTQRVVNHTNCSFFAGICNGGCTGSYDEYVHPCGYGCCASLALNASCA